MHGRVARVRIWYRVERTGGGPRCDREQGGGGGGGTIPLIVGRIFKFESRISLGPPAMGHRSQSIRGESLSFSFSLCPPRVTKNRIRAAKKTDLSLSLFLSSPATRDAFACEKASLQKNREPEDSRYFRTLRR